MMSLVVILKATLVLTVGCAALLTLRSASAAARHFLCAFTLAVSVLVFFAAGMSWGIESKTFAFTVDAARMVNADTGCSTGILGAIWIAGALALALRFLSGLVYVAWQTRRASIPDYSVTAEGASPFGRRIDTAGLGLVPSNRADAVFVVWISASGARSGDCS